MIFVVILIVMAWLLTHGYSVDIAMETAAGAGVLAAGIASRLTRTQQIDNLEPRNHRKRPGNV